MPRLNLFAIACAALVGAAIGILATRPGRETAAREAGREAVVAVVDSNAADKRPVGVTTAAAADRPLTTRRDPIPESDAAMDADAKLATLSARVDELEQELARLRARIAAGDPRMRELATAFALNQLRHAEAERAIAELVICDPEAVAADPRPLFELVTRFADEIGLASAPLVRGQRLVAPEPEAPETVLSLDSSAAIDPSTLEMRQRAYLHFKLVLPKRPEDWLGDPVELTIDLRIDRSPKIQTQMTLEVDPQRTGRSITWGFDLSPDETTWWCSPMRGGEGGGHGGPDDLQDQRRLVDEVFAWAWLRAR